MAAMLPAPFSHRFSLADVLPAMLGAVRGETNGLGLPPVDNAILLVIDGLGSHMLASRAGHARTLASAPSFKLQSGFPTTTAAALTTLTTGAHPGTHGMVGYSVRHPGTGAVLNQLNGWGGALDPVSWQRCRTQFEIARDHGVTSIAVGAARYEDSGFTRAILRGADYAVAAELSERLHVARAQLDAAGGGLAYVYVPELDQVAHRYGWESERWLAALEELDAAVRSFVASPRGREGILVTADHGMVDVPSSGHVMFDEIDGLLDGVVAVAGEPRCLQLHLEPGLSPAERAEIVRRWEASESQRSWVVTREDAIGAGWFGAVVDDEVAPRLGDVFVAARKRIAYYDGRTASQSALAMVGQHGSLGPEETTVPLIRFGAFA